MAKKSPIIKQDAGQVAFNAILYQIKTEVAGGWRITFDVPEHDTEAMSVISHMRDKALTVAVVVTPDEWALNE